MMSRSTELHSSTPGVSQDDELTTTRPLLSTARMKFSLLTSLLYFLASAQAQLSGEVTGKDLADPASSGENPENLLGDFESEKLDHRRRRRRKMLPLSTSSPALKLPGPTEPRITVSSFSSPQTS